MSATRKSRYAAEENLKAFFGRHEVVYYWTFTFAENLDDKELAGRRFKPLQDLIRRRGGEELHFWETQKRGALHVHLVTNLYLSVDFLRGNPVEPGFMVARGWGPIMRVERVASHARYGPDGWQREASKEMGLIRYLLKYLTKSMHDAHRWEKPWGGSASAKVINTRFRWVPWISASCFLFHVGRAALFEIFGETPGRMTLEMVHHCIRIGYEVTDWASYDPWFYT